MIDKILDVYYFIKDKLEELWWFIQDNIKMTLGLIGVVGFVILVVSILNVDKKNNSGVAGEFEENSTEQLAYMKDNSETLKEVFSELQVYDTSVDNNPVLEVALFLKQPFITYDDLQLNLDTYVELLKLKYNDTESDTKVRAIRISVYDREVIFENDLPANGTYMYMLSSENIEEVDEEDSSYDTANVGMTTLAWEQTVESKKEPDYSKYQATLDFQELKNDPSVVPLTDEEFAWFLKFEQYMALGGGVSSGARLYLQWDLGANLDEGGFLAVIDSFELFIDRLEAMDARTEYYTDDPDSLRRSLVITNPQFLLFADHEEILEEPFAARARLIEVNPEMYTDSVEVWIEEQADNYTEADDPASVDNPDNKTNTQLIEDGELETQEEDILDQSSDVEGSETDSSTEEAPAEETPSESVEEPKE